MYIATTGGHQVPTNSIEERDPLPVFYKRKVQFLLKSMTGFDLAKVFSQRLVPDYSMPKFVLVTDEELIQVYVIFIGFSVMVFNATFKNISGISVAISFIGGRNWSTHRDHHRPAASH